ncbi:MAG: hypothetical protein EBS39_06450, partial [Gammaproteobacteria bacterium]|nr:hypothetical protein [Gammaproteobacteria bacterium]
MKAWHKAVIFLAGAVVGGLALAFLAVAWRPELLADRLAARQAALAGAGAAVPGRASGSGAGAQQG